MYPVLLLEGIVGLAPMLAAVMLAPAAAGGLGIQLPRWTGLLIALGTAGLIGWFNGFMVVKVGAFISTLGLLVLLRGGVLIVSSGRRAGMPRDIGCMHPADAATSEHCDSQYVRCPP